MYENKIIILCEGDTEKNAVNIFLRNAFRKSTTSIGLKPLIAGKVKKMVDYAMDAFEKNTRAVFTLYDIYRFDCPEFSSSDDVDIRIRKGKKYLMERIGGDSRFHPHFAVHEIEAWYFADDEAMQRLFKTNDTFQHSHPETIDFQNHPSKRINEYSIRYRKTRYNKIIDSQRIFKKLNFDLVYDRCPHFRNFWDELRSVAQG